METTKTQTTTPPHFDDSKVCNWTLPEGAIARLGRGNVRDMEQKTKQLMGSIPPAFLQI